MYTSQQLIQCFGEYQRDDAFRLNLGLPEHVIERADIAGREASTQKNLSYESFEDIDSAQGTTNFRQMVDLLEKFELYGCLPDLRGLGLELGSGIGILSCAMLSRFSSVAINGILAVEAVPSFVSSGITTAGKETLKENYYKLLPCYGIFESVDIEDNQIDFIIQIESLHHATDLRVAIKEAHRILKPGGLLVSIDRSWPNKVTDDFLNRLLDHEYEQEWLDKRGFPKDKIKTRRDNGEHEYRDSEWKDAFEESGFEKLFFLPFHPKLKAWHLAKRFLGLIGLSKLFNSPARPGMFRGLLCQALKINPLKLRAMPITNHPRALTYMVYQKK